MKSYLNILIALFLSISVSVGQFNSNFQGFLEELVFDLEHELDPIGLSISVRSGENEWSDVIGISAVDDSLTNSSIFAMASTTKTITSAGILKLMEENRLSLSDPIHMYLPSFDNIDSIATIKELLNHTSGIFNYSEHPEYFDIVFDDQNQFYTYSPEEVLELFVLEKRFDRGTAQEYSNTNYILLGMIITEIADRPFYEEIFETFNMPQNYPSFSYPPVNSDISELADLWVDLGEGLQNASELGYGLDGLFSSAGSSGAFVGTSADVAKWGYDLYSGKLLKESTMDSLFNYHPFLLNGMDEYGLGVLGIETNCGVKAVGHDGYLFYGSDLVYFEDHDLSVAVMTNQDQSLSEIGGIRSISDEIICAYNNFLMTNSDDIIQKVNVEIYPNPTHDLVNINLPQNFDASVQIEVYDKIGTLLYSQKIQNEKQQTIQIDCLSEQSKGFYFVKIFDDENLHIQKIIKG